MKYLLAFLAGAGAGVVGTYLYFRNRIDTIVKDTVNEEMERFFTRQEQMMSAPEVEEVTPDEEEKEIVTDIPDTTEKTSIVKMEEIVRTQYRKDNDGIEEDEDFDDEEDDISDEEIAEMIGGQRKRMEEGTRYITEQEHDTTCIGYDHAEFTYYPDGNILTDAQDNAVEFPEVYFENLNWREEIKDKEFIIIRNPEEASDYTIWNDKFVK